MTALAYLLLPLSGLVAFLTGGSARLRFHGLQAIVFGTAWAIALYVASWVATGATIAVALVGALLWVGLMGGVAMGRDPGLPFVAPALWKVATPER